MDSCVDEAVLTLAQARTRSEVQTRLSPNSTAKYAFCRLLKLVTRVTLRKVDSSVYGHENGSEAILKRV